MIKNEIISKSDVISILNALIKNIDETKQGYYLYSGTLDKLISENITKEEAYLIYRSYIGYLAHGEFSNNEYNKVKIISDYFYEISKQ